MYVPSSRVAEIDPHEARRRADAGALLLDVREPMEFAQVRAPGATLLPLGELGHRVGELDRERPIVAVCRSGNRSGTAANWLAQQGFDVANLAGGMIAWLNAGLPTDGGH